MADQKTFIVSEYHGWTITLRADDYGWWGEATSPNGQRTISFGDLEADDEAEARRCLEEAVEEARCVAALSG